MLLETVEWSDMVLVNTMPGICSGGPSRVQVREDGTQQSTIDYIICSPDMAPHVESMAIHENQMGSDHRPLVLSLRGLDLKSPGGTHSREVWRIDALLTQPDRSFVEASVPSLAVGSATRAASFELLVRWELKPRACRMCWTGVSSELLTKQRPPIWAPNGWGL